MNSQAFWSVAFLSTCSSGLAQQDPAQLNQLKGFDIQIIEIRPMTSMPFLSELPHKLQENSSLASVS